MAKKRRARKNKSGGADDDGDAQGSKKFVDEDPDDVLGLNDGGVEADSDDEEDGVADDVMGLEDDENDYGEEAEEEAEGGASGAIDKDGEEGQPGSKGWRGADFYGGDDVGDDDDGSEEELVLEEARKLEERRLARIRGEVDVLGSLLGPADTEAAEPTEDKTAEGVTDTAIEGAASAKFESVFADQAERSSVTRDVSKLSEAKRRSLIKKEAPELAPLLEDFRTKLDSYREVAPLLHSPALRRFPSSGKAYLEAKASLLLNTLANLSYYLLVKAEGGTVRAHPVVSQLVWLRELSEQLKSLDQRLNPKLKRALKAARRLAKTGSTPGAPGPVAEAEAGVPPAEDAAAEAKPRRTLRERLEGLKACVAKAKVSTGRNAVGAAAPGDGAVGLDTDDLLRLPTAAGAGGKAQRRKKKIAADAPEDLDEVDPTLGAWMPTTSLNEHLTSVKQQLGEQAAKSRPESAELNVEARQRRARTRAVESPDAPVPGGRGPIREVAPEAAVGADAGEDAEATALLRQVAQAAKVKKDRKVAERAAEQEDARWRQYRPEEEVDGRRDTSKRILENRGLVRQRKKKSGNARLVNRGKYEKFVKKRKSQVQDVREGADDGATYKGEETGLRTHLRKSLRLS